MLRRFWKVPSEREWSKVTTNELLKAIFDLNPYAANTDGDFCVRRVQREKQHWLKSIPRSEE